MERERDNRAMWARAGGNWWSGRVLVLSAVLLVACGASAGAASGASSRPWARIVLSPASGPPGTLVQLRGDVGPACAGGRNWWGLVFSPYGQEGLGAGVRMRPLVAQTGDWTATFTVPAYIGSLAGSGPGSAVAPGRYEFASLTCAAQVVLRAAFRVTAGDVPGWQDRFVAIAATNDGGGYWLVQADGRVTSFGDAGRYGSLPASPASATQAVVAMARSADGRGYWLAGADGRVYPFGDAGAYGSVAPATLATPVVSFSATPSGRGYWLLGAGGQVYAFGDAQVQGAPASSLGPFSALAALPQGGFLVDQASAPEAYLYPGGAPMGGGMGVPVSTTVVAAAAPPTGGGVWLAGTDGGVFAWGNAHYYGSLPGDGLAPEAPITAMAATADGRGYWLLGADGNIFSFGDARFLGFSVRPQD